MLHCGSDGLLDLGLNPDIGLQADGNSAGRFDLLGYGVGTILNQIGNKDLAPLGTPLEGALAPKPSSATCDYDALPLKSIRHVSFPPLQQTNVNMRIRLGVSDAVRHLTSPRDRCHPITSEEVPRHGGAVACRSTVNPQPHSSLPPKKSDRFLYRSLLILNNRCVKRYPVTQFRDQLPGAMEEARHEAVVVERHGEPAAMLISVELLEASEELEDIKSFDASLEEEGENLPWDEVRRELGW
jgi:PHD/YefM family antitoxin component YafN of YafNO toxin-antitoxin module